MAVTHSDGQQALEGGDLGWRQASELPTIFADAVLQLEVGDVSEPIRSPSGFHLVKLVDRRGSERQMIRQTRARHILIALDELTDDADRTPPGVGIARANRQRTGFRRARPHLIPTIRAPLPEGGELGWIDPGNTVPVFERMMDSLRSGRDQRAVQVAIRMASRPGAGTARTRRHRDLAAGRSNCAGCGRGRSRRTRRRGSVACATRPTWNTGSANESDALPR